MSREFDQHRHAIRRDIEAIVGSLAQPRDALVASVDPANHSVRVRIMPEDVLSGWIPDASAMSAGGGYGIVAPPSVGDQVHVVFAHGDQDHPRIVGRIFSVQDLPPVSPATGKAVQPREFAVFCPGAWLHFSGGVIHAEATSIQFKGDVFVDGKITSTGDQVAGTVSQQHHTHGGVKAGGDHTAQPDQ